MIPALLLGLLILAAWIVQGVALLRGLPRVRTVTAATEPYRPWRPPDAPLVSAVVPARDEAAALERAIRSLLAQDYPALEVIAVDDRSTDATPAILARLAAEEARLRVVRIDRIPETPAGEPAWLGKPHALHVGAQLARGEWLLFTDADVVHEPTVVSRAMRIALGDGRDHLTVIPRVVVTSRLERAFMAAFGLVFLLARRIWAVPDPKSRASAGVGAFNLVRRALYDRLGGHAALRYEVIDDLALGDAAKGAGGRSEAVFADGLVWLRWYPTVRAMIDGLSKNSFAAVGYSVARVLVALAMQLLLGLGPYLGLLLAPGAARLPYLAAVLGITVGITAYVRQGPDPGDLLDALLFPVAIALLMAAFVRSTWRTLARGGVEWRGTLYPLSLLRAGSRFRA